MKYLISQIKQYTVEASNEDEAIEVARNNKASFEQLSWSAYSYDFNEKTSPKYDCDEEINIDKLVEITRAQIEELNLKPEDTYYGVLNSSTFDEAVMTFKKSVELCQLYLFHPFSQLMLDAIYVVYQTLRCLSGLVLKYDLLI